jgi:hypothetical protein
MSSLYYIFSGASKASSRTLDYFLAPTLAFSVGTYGIDSGKKEI